MRKPLTLRILSALDTKSWIALGIFLALALLVVPVLHLNQLIGLSFGIKDKVLGVHTHMVATRDIAKKAKRARMDLEAET